MTDENQDQLIHQILASGGAYDDLLHRPLLDATRQIARGVPVSASLRTQVLDDVMELWAENPFIQTRAVINEIFIGISNPQFADEVSTRLLEIPTIESARLAGLLGKTEEATAFLLEKLADEMAHPGNEDDIVEAAIVLNQIGEKEKAAFVLLQIVEELQFQPEINNAIGLIAQSDTSNLQSKNALLDIARDTEANSELRVAAACSLLDVDEPQQAISILREIALHPDSEDEERQRAARGLGEAGEWELAVSILVELLQDSQTNKVVACHAAEDLVRLENTEIGIQFLTNAAKPGAPCVICDCVICGCGREFIAEKLIKLGKEELAESLLISGLQDNRLITLSRLGHASMLARLGNKSEAAPVLLKAARSVNSFDYVYRMALEGLGKCGGCDKEILGVLLGIAQNEKIKSDVRRNAIEAIGNFGNSSPDVLEFLAEIARTNPDTSLRRTACESLWKLTEGSNAHPEQNKC